MTDINPEAILWWATNQLNRTNNRLTQIEQGQVTYVTTVIHSCNTRIDDSPRIFKYEGD